MALFQTSVLKNYLKRQDAEPVAKAYKKFSKYFHNPSIQQNIREIKEEGFQQKFLMELFVNVFGYVINPDQNYNLTTEYKNEKGAKKADGAILLDGNALGVIELKSTKTKDLENIRLQAFDYKVNQTGCIYVITSNFEKLRFYINNAVEFEEFDLFTLTQNQFELLYLCLHKDNLLSNVPLKIKEASVREEEVITKKFYNDYSLFKRELFRDLVKLNMKNEVFRSEFNREDTERANKNIKHNLFKKSQKLIDRFLFIFFAEDRDLLPPNSTLKILEQWNKLKDLDAYAPLYDRFKLYFGYLDTGRKGTDKGAEIFAYNGGLFKPDPILDSLQISDELLFKHTEALSKYDFESQVDVNILGHIFENSLNEIESVNAEIEGVEFDKQKTKRKKDGVFYTPKYITKYIVDNTIGKLCEEKKAELKIIDEEYTKNRKGRTTAKLKELRDQLENYRNWLLQITICDPACGSGAFLNQALDFLIKEHQYIDELQTSLLGGGFVFPDIENTVLENNIFGVDLNEESVEIAKLSLWLRTAQPRRKLNDLSSNIKCGNSLIDSKAVAGDKAFKWEDEFPQVFAKGGFDVVIGNPPYGVNFNQKEKEYLLNFDELVPDFEIYIYFISLYRTILKKKGVLSYIFPNTFLSILYGKKYREIIFNEVSIDEIVDLSQDNTFVDASVRTIIFSFTNNNSNYKTIFQKVINKEFSYVDTYEKESILKEIENVSSLLSQKREEKQIINKIKINQELSKFFDVSQGLIPYDKYRGHDEFTIKNRIWHSDYKKDDSFKKELKGGDVTAYNVSWNGGLWISYGDWLAAPREPKFFNQKRVLVREITSDRLQCGYTCDEYYNTPSLINIVESGCELDLKYLLTIINSSLIGWYHNKTSPKANKGLFPKILVNDVRKIPLKKISSKEQHPFIEKANLMINLNQAFHEVLKVFINLLRSKFNLEKLTKKLENWHELEFGDFLKELKKVKVQLSLSEEAEWMQYFNEQKQKAQTLKAEIDKTDKEIDKMVYELYGLSEEEIKIVEEN